MKKYNHKREDFYEAVGLEEKEKELVKKGINIADKFNQKDHVRVSELIELLEEKTKKLKRREIIVLAFFHGRCYQQFEEAHSMLNEILGGDEGERRKGLKM